MELFNKLTFNFENFKYNQEMIYSQNRMLGYNAKVRADTRRKAIADEKRMWTIRHYTKNGKPDRQRSAQFF